MQGIARLRRRYGADYCLWIEVFVTCNYLALVFDIYLAHSGNQFHRKTEYIPLYFSGIAALVLMLALACRERWRWMEAWRDLGYLVGAVSILIGVAGVVLHLDSQLFYEKTLKSLTYAAPFAAPLAYTGLGLLLILNRMIDAHIKEWAYWLLVLDAGGYFGNFILSLTDHASNGFFRPVEWVPVISAAFATSFLLVPLMMQVPRVFLKLCAGVLLVQALVGFLGFLFHAQQNLRAGPGLSFEAIINGAPPMAPLLFVNLVPLGLIGLWALYADISSPNP